MPSLRVLSALAAVAAQAGCAGMTPQHAVSITTNPTGAACLVTAGREPITELASSPGVVRLPQSPRDARVFCTHTGHAPTAAALPTEIDSERMAASAILGGAGGLAGAALSGSGYRYAPALDVRLLPVRFAATAERDRFFADRTAETHRYFDPTIQAQKSMCRPDEFGCQTMIAGVVNARDTELERLEAQRQAAQLVP